MTLAVLREICIALERLIKWMPCAKLGIHFYDIWSCLIRTRANLGLDQVRVGDTRRGTGYFGF